MSRPGARRGMAVGDALLVLSVLALGFALAYPRIRRTALSDKIEQAVVDVQAVVDAAERFRAEEGRWPDPTDPGVVPAGLARYLPTGMAFDGENYRLRFNVWETAAEPPPTEAPAESALLRGEIPPDTTTPPPDTLFGSLAGVTVESPQPWILAGLMDRFGTDRSFLHEERWTFVIGSIPAR